MREFYRTIQDSDDFYNDPRINVWRRKTPDTESIPILPYDPNPSKEYDQPRPEVLIDLPEKPKYEQPEADRGVETWKIMEYRI